MNDDFRHIKIHIFAMPSRNEIKRSLHKTKHVVGKIKRQKRSSGTKKEKAVVRNIMLKTA